MMLRVYLDQNKWVDLARAAVGHPLGEPFQDALAMCRAAVQSGIVSFPLDMYRYWETSKRGSDRSRNEVVDVMRELSRQHTMAVPVAVLDHELDLALQRRYGRPARPREQKVFGVGLRHIAGDRMEWPELDLSRHPQVAAALPPGVRAQLDNAFCEYLEEYLLRAGPTTYRGLGFDRADSNHAERFVEFENKLSAAIQQRGLTGDAIDIAVRAADFGDIKPAIIAALQNIGMTYEQFEGSLTARGLLQFMDDLPTRYVTNVLRSAKHRQTQQKWEPNDFTDIVAPEAVKIFEAGWLGIH